MPSTSPSSFIILVAFITSFRSLSLQQRPRLHLSAYVVVSCPRLRASSSTLFLNLLCISSEIVDIIQTLMRCPIYINGPHRFSSTCSPLTPSELATIQQIIGDATSKL
ncbi:hypothetical protein GBA52_024119 [Prunus armeniaca]|nr:hypothetical protein GBA52_024119 [Prunus armeniaca]